MKKYTYFAFLYDGDGGEGVCLTTKFKPTPNKQAIFQFDTAVELTEYLIKNDEYYSEYGHDMTISYVLHLIHVAQEED